MTILVFFAFIAGIVTILSPCILPILPVVLSTSVGEGRAAQMRPVGVITGFIGSFTFFTLFLSGIVRTLGIPADSMRLVAVFILIAFGLILMVPRIQVVFEQAISKLSGIVPQPKHSSGFFGGFLVGLSLGLIWTPCVGPILASVITLALTGSVNFDAFFITLAYATGTAIPMFAIMVGGRKALNSVPAITNNIATIQKVFGVLTIGVGLAILFNADRAFQAYLLQTFPQYGAGLTKIEDNPLVIEALYAIQDRKNGTQPGGAGKLDVGSGGAAGNEGKESDVDRRNDVNTEADGSIDGTPSILLPQETKAPEIIPGGAWFNSEGFSLEDKRGEVVLVDFWTYSCINCQRTLPYLRDWDRTYRNQGLTILGVHAPEFEFEKSEDNVRQAIADFTIEYPVVQDNEFSTWRAYQNRYWPAKYLIDADGYIRYVHFGEGKYDEIEQAIQLLLEEAEKSQASDGLIDNLSYTNQSK